MLKLFHAIILSLRRSTEDKIIACNYCTWNHSFSEFFSGSYFRVNDTRIWPLFRFKKFTSLFRNSGCKNS